MGYVKWPRPFQGRFVICRLGRAMFSLHILNLKCLRLPATKKCKNFRFERPFGEFRGNVRVYLWLDGKCIVDFLLAMIELFSLALTAVALLSEICRNRRFLKEWVTLSANFR